MRARIHRHLEAAAPTGAPREARMMVPVPVRMPAAVLLLSVLIACAEVATGGGATICDTAKCGKGTCSEMLGQVPFVTTSYNYT